MEQNQSQEPTLIIKKMNEYSPRPISWLEEGRIALGKLTLIAGDPGLGKSFLTLDLCAKISKGELGRTLWESPGKQSFARSVILSAEDDADDTITPRLIGMDADLGLIHFVEGVKRGAGRADDLIELDKHFDILEKTIASLANVCLIVIDPISAYMGKADSNNNAEVRAVLARLAALAQNTGAAVVCITHLNKDSGNKRAVYRAMGSLAFTAAARTVHLVTKHPNDDNKRVVSMVKNNIGKPMPPRVFTIDQDQLRWLDETVDLSADQLDGNDRPIIEEDSIIDRAIALINDEITDKPRLANELITLANEQGINQAALSRARSTLTIISEKIGTHWYWKRPPAPGQYEHPQANNPTQEQLFDDGYEGYL